MWYIQRVRRTGILLPAVLISILVVSCDDGGDGDGDNRLKGPNLEQGVVGRVFFEKRTITDGILSGADNVVLVARNQLREPRQRGRKRAGQEREQAAEAA